MIGTIANTKYTPVAVVTVVDMYICMKIHLDGIMLRWRWLSEILWYSGGYIFKIRLRYERKPHCTQFLFYHAASLIGILGRHACT